MSLSQGEDEPDTSTASDESGNGPWTVVTSPTHKRTDSVEASSPVPEEPLEPTDALKEPTEVCLLPFIPSCVFYEGLIPFSPLTQCLNDSAAEYLLEIANGYWLSLIINASFETFEAP